jgi:hypothetical protein
MAETPETPKKVWKPDFLEALRETATVTEACRVAGIGRATAYRARQQDEAFAVAWADVEEESTETLESVAVQRAKDGSDTLMIFLLKSRRPQKYRENVKIEHGGEIRTDLDELTRDQLRERARVLLGE